MFKDEMLLELDKWKERAQAAELLNGVMRNEIALLMEYIHATEFWSIEPHDQKERRAYLAKIGKAGLALKTNAPEKPACEHDWQEVGPESAHVIRKKCRKCGSFGL